VPPMLLVLLLGWLHARQTKAAALTS